MIKAVKSQCAIMFSKQSFWIAFFGVLIYALATYLHYVQKYLGQDVSIMCEWREITCINSTNDFFDYFKLLFPFLIVLPFATSYFQDNYYKMECAFARRMGRKKYFVAKGITCFLGGIMIILIPFLINLVLTYITFPQTGNLYEGSFIYTHLAWECYGDSYPAVAVFFSHPFFYESIFCVALSLFAGIFSVLAYVCSFWVKKYMLLIFLPVYLLSWALALFPGGGIELLYFVSVGGTEHSYLIFIGIVLAILGVSVYLIRKKIKEDML